jgi:poly(hydroxyalkanoate) depolymerase family esterase
MRDTLKAVMAEALHLTRSGRLVEATSVLRGFSGGGSASADTPGAPDPASRPCRWTVPGTAGRTIEYEAPPPRRTGLAATLRGLANVRQGFKTGTAGIARPSPAPTPAAGAAFVAGQYANDAGGRSYKLYVPANRPDGLRPLIVMLHGCTQSADDFATGTGMNALAEAAGCFVVYPEQSAGANPQRCWNWFDPKDQHRDGGEPSILAGIVRALVDEQPIDPDRIHVAGLSAGGATAAVMGAAYPDLFASVGVHSGLATGAARDLPSALLAMRRGARPTSTGSGPPVPTIVFHGDQDTTVHPRNADAVAEQATAGLKDVTSRVETGWAPTGRSYRREIMTGADGLVLCERWSVQGAGHAWSGGDTAGSYTDPTGPDASGEMLRFFLDTRRPANRTRR